jgi:hypothetical protein
LTRHGLTTSATATTHGHVRERLILALEGGCLFRVSSAPQACACCAKEASCLPPTGFEDRPHLLGVTRTTCGSKGRAKVAGDAPKVRLRAFSSVPNVEASSRSFGDDVLQFPPLSPFGHPMSPSWDPMRGWSARSACRRHYFYFFRNRFEIRNDLAPPFTHDSPSLLGTLDRRRYAIPRRMTAAR